ncbi:haloacid dehalogenase-like hydrolase domain-containing protein 2 [Coprinopsis cinerea okayama7|uniref:Haloacid dehalogenase-like hydrolase domain-containing protein 2 n=1 Tax=Coprinopsis cinerea (strain Okayama-7 / 130 / ATCC MYA-4618 / FGSC 9003) TaxID=240176 RepID=A8P849_COPC7|nr:haloacid dehalogenase-like hydrolase domain-containing protein 2 [Coprinopsis cinerea okayama7\|eukprot:XP_001839500.1 haloacid dehalogenase-like hydrolase domain-containing protein 2 [Coprinopsis cinerea okayama7\
MTARPHIKALLIDISGNLHVGSNPTSNAVDALKRLRGSRIPFRLCSNSSKESTASLIGRLRKLGFDFQDVNESGGGDKKEVWTSIGSVARSLREKGLKRPYLLLSKSASEEVLAELSGEPGTSTTNGTAEGFDSVVVGLAPGVFDYDHLNKAFRILMGEEGDGSPKGPHRPPLIATHKAKYVEKDNPPGLSLGPGPFVTALEHASGSKAHVVGKPTRAFFELVIRDFGPSELSPGEDSEGKIAVIGDDVEADLGEGALELGLWRVLVKTGKYRPGDEKRPGTIPPDEVFNSFADFIDDLLRTQLKQPSNSGTRHDDKPPLSM